MMFWLIAAYCVGVLLTFGFHFHHLVRNKIFYDVPRVIISLFLGVVWLVWTPFFLTYMLIRDCS